HDMASARKIADRIAMLYKGKIIWAGPVEEIDQADNDFLKQFIHGNAEGPIDFETRVS
ncbi:MAG TPA: ABC transporter ATP-binding protein, partial [Rhodospirillaceae bacterium]|nr:ABC transporter ATP-binding protein [Rhodospirillaceae bacterium]